jgi:hypothetical protein
MNNPLIRQPARRGQDRLPQLERFKPYLLKRFESAQFPDLAGHTLRQQKPPWNNISVPGIDNYIYILVQKITLNNFDVLIIHSLLDTVRILLIADCDSPTDLLGLQPDKSGLQLFDMLMHVRQ